jgi:hypothetical protein
MEPIPPQQPAPVPEMAQLAGALTAMAQLQVQNQQLMADMQAAQFALQQQVLQNAAAVANPGATSIVKNIMLDNFSGDRDSIELDTWLFQVDEYFGANPGATEDNKVRFAGTLLHGQAAAWWRGQTAQRPTTWQSFADELKGMFMPLARSHVARQKLA